MAVAVDVSAESGAVLTSASEGGKGWEALGQRQPSLSVIGGAVGDAILRLSCCGPRPNFSEAALGKGRWGVSYRRSLASTRREYGTKVITISTETGHLHETL